MSAKTYKLIIAGSRSWTDYPTVIEAVRRFVKRARVKSPLEIVSGTARGADRLGEKLAKEHNLKLTRMPANWRPNGILNRAAGYQRNERMARYADGCIVLWDGYSKGSRHMYDLARKHKLQVMLVKAPKPLCSHAGTIMKERPDRVRSIVSEPEQVPYCPDCRSFV